MSYHQDNGYTGPASVYQDQIEEVYEREQEIERMCVELSGCCAAVILPPDICSECREHCEPLREDDE